MVGFNRRFSPFARWLKDRFAGIPEPLAVHCTVNAGPVPPDHWTHDPEQGGGRIIGEVCHFVDLIEYLTGSLPVRVYAETLESPGYQPSDNVVITLKMANGAIGSITYVAGGDKRYPRERVEVFGGGAVGVIENFKAATFIRGGRKKRVRNWLSVDRGHRGEVEALLSAIRTGGPAPVAFEEYVYTTLATFAIEKSLRSTQPVAVDPHSLFVNEPQETGSCGA
jgi:polar amino acid transport system substrate-binding protein